MKRRRFCRLFYYKIFLKIFIFHLDNAFSICYYFTEILKKIMSEKSDDLRIAGQETRESSLCEMWWTAA